jgi:5-(carboxyamino)imidazole ribonucleotide synthase
MRQILPGATIGILGSGQLGRMLAMAARQMGYGVHVFSPDAQSPAGQVAGYEMVRDYEDLDALAEFCRHVDVVTFEFENVPVAATARAESLVPVYPSGAVLHTTQHRLREKTFLKSQGFPATTWLPYPGPIPSNFPFPAVLKTAGFGYDGKGQIKVAGPGDLLAAHAALDSADCVLEAWVTYECELSMVAARGRDGSFADYGLFANSHVNHILDVTRSHPQLSARTLADAREITRGIFEKLDIVGTACVEFFLRADGALLVNEIAPRPHNSGHLTIEAAPASQFEQQLRAICGLPLGEATLAAPAAMANLLGDLWQGGEPNWAALLSVPGAHLHLYGKQEARPGRKMGHITALGNDPHLAAVQVLAARKALLL